MRKKFKTLGLVVLAGAGAVLAGVMLQPQSTQSVVSEGRKSERSAERSAAPQSPFATLPSREEMGRPQGSPFGFLPPPAPPPGKQQMQAEVVAPTPPPMPYRVAGQVVREGVAHVVLSVGEKVLTVRAGEKLDDGYIVESINAEGVTLIYVPLNARQTLPFTSALGLDVPLATAALDSPAEKAPAPQAAAGGEAKPARLRWDGPERVRAGDTFDVALRVTSERPVRASPLSLTFDAKLLEPVNVKPGDFFSGGSFNYRINPAGSIFVGALSPGAAAKDAEFVVVTFRSIRAGTTAELRLSSFALHGVAGGTIAHDRPADFRTAIQ